MQYGKDLMKKWYIDNTITCLNHGSFGAAPKCVVEKGHEIEQKIESHTMKFFLEDYPIMLKKALSNISNFLNSPTENTVFVENATAGVGTVLRSIVPNLKKGDKILITNHIYPAVEYTLDYLSKIFDFDLVKINIPFPLESQEQVIDKIKNNLSEKVKIALFDHITSATGLVFPVKEICKICKENDVISIVDGAHAPGMLDLNIMDLDCDFYIGNCHKWLFTQKGCAVLYINSKFVEQIHPLNISNFYGQGLQNEFAWTATRNVAPWLSSIEALKFYESLGGAELRKHNYQLLLNGGELIRKELNTNKLAPEDMLGSILTCELPEKFKYQNNDTIKLWKHFLDVYGIETMFVNFENKLYFRISAQAYNEIEDYERLCEALLKELV